MGQLTAADRLDGRTALVTGASSGLGYATTVELARRGARVLMACRSRIPEARDEARVQAASMDIEALPVDLSDIDSIRELCRALAERGERIDLLVLNAAVVPAEARRTAQALPEMFMVNYFSSFLLVRQLLDDRLLLGGPDDGGDPSNGQPRPRIVIVTSEAHRSGADLEFGEIERFVPHSIGQAVARYGYYKLMLTTFATELDRRLNPADAVRCAVHSLCPGAVNTNIAREVPKRILPLARLVLRVAFRDPFEANQPVVFLAASRSLEETSGLYLHRFTRKPADPRALSIDAGQALWTESEALRERLWRS